jgi:hypothetical protein
MNKQDIINSAITKAEALIKNNPLNVKRGRKFGTEAQREFAQDVYTKYVMCLGAELFANAEIKNDTAKAERFEKKVVELIGKRDAVAVLETWADRIKQMRFGDVDAVEYLNNSRVFG